MVKASTVKARNLSVKRREIKLSARANRNHFAELSAALRVRHAPSRLSAAATAYVSCSLLSALKCQYTRFLQYQRVADWQTCITASRQSRRLQIYGQVYIRMKVLVTGTEGYIGSRLAPMLMARGHDVVGLDAGFYRDGWLYSDPRQLGLVPRTIIKDLRRVEQKDFEGFDAVVHLAELSNDPLGENRPEITYQINHLGSLELARKAKAAGVKRFVYASSCSVYGVGSGEFLDETSPVNPQTAYAKCKVMVERDVKPLVDANFCATFLRNATAYGASPRMRFDIVLNDLCALAWTNKRIAMTSDGSPWRPIVHIEDIATAVRCVLDAPVEAVSGETFNVGQNSENYRVREIAQIVADVFPGCELTTGKAGADNRSYRVSFDKIATRLPGFSCAWTARRGAEELRSRFEQIEFNKETYEYRAFTRLKQIRYLSRTGQIDDDFYWR
jgi:nucleoside-diphosphate-sugar epimerase